MTERAEQIIEQAVRITAGRVTLDGDLSIPPDASGVVLFAHGSGSGRHSPRNQLVARRLQQAGLATILMDLLTPEEEAVDRQTAHLRFDIGLLAERLIGATDWLIDTPATAMMRIGYFGASTGAAAALVAAAERARQISAVVSRGGRPDLAGSALARVQAPTLLIVGGEDVPVIPLNESAFAKLSLPPAAKRLAIVPGATHLFEEPGKLDEVAHLAADWFAHYLSTNVLPLFDQEVAPGMSPPLA